MRHIIKSPAGLALGFDTVLAAAGLWSQWFGAHYVRAHGLDAWPFGFLPFLMITFAVFVVAGVIAFRITSERRQRVVLVTASTLLWLACAYGGLLLWLNIYGS